MNVAVYEAAATVLQEARKGAQNEAGVEEWTEAEAEAEAEETAPLFTAEIYAHLNHSHQN